MILINKLPSKIDDTVIILLFIILFGFALHDCDTAL